MIKISKKDADSIRKEVASYLNINKIDTCSYDANAYSTGKKNLLKTLVKSAIECSNADNKYRYNQKRFIQYIVDNFQYQDLVEKDIIFLLLQHNIDLLNKQSRVNIYLLLRWQILLLNVLKWLIYFLNLRKLY